MKYTNAPMKPRKIGMATASHTHGLMLTHSNYTTHQRMFSRPWCKTRP